MLPSLAPESGQVVTPCVTRPSKQLFLPGDLSIKFMISIIDTIIKFADVDSN